MAPSDMTTRYFSETGQPLLTAKQAAFMVDVKPGTIRQWVARRHLEATGMDEAGQQLFAADDVTRVKASLRPRRRAALAA